MFIQNVERERQDPRVVFSIKSKLSSIESQSKGHDQSSARPSALHGSSSDCDVSDNDGDDQIREKLKSPSDIMSMRSVMYHSKNVSPRSTPRKSLSHTQHSSSFTS